MSIKDTESSTGILKFVKRHPCDIQGRQWDAVSTADECGFAEPYRCGRQLSSPAVWDRHLYH
jgi:hypothetical protein